VSGSPTTSALQDAEILTSRPPGYAASAVAKEFISFVQAHADDLRGLYSLREAEKLPPREGSSADMHLDLRFGWVYDAKMNPEVFNALHDAGLADASEEDWLRMHPALADVYMCALAAEMAAEGKNTPITDTSVHHVAAAGWSFDDLARALLPQRDTAPDSPPMSPGLPDELVVTVALKSIALRNPQDLPIARIIKLRSMHGADFYRFRERVDALCASVASLGDITDVRALADHVAVEYDKTVNVELQELRNALRGRGVDVVDTVIGVSTVASQLVAAESLSSLAGAPGLGSAKTAVDVWKKSQSARDRRAHAMSRSPAAWLLRIEEAQTPSGLIELLRIEEAQTPSGLIERLRSLARRFTG
jgi:hypothetical protein